MPAPKAQQVTLATLAGDRVVFVADGREVTIDGLNTNTVSQLARRLGLDMPRTATDIDRRAAIVQAVADGRRLSDPAPVAEAVADDPTPVADPVEPAPDPAPRTLETVDDSDGLASARSALGVPSTADVAAYVDARVADAVGKVRPTVTVVRVKGRPDVELPGRRHEQFAKVLDVLARGRSPFLTGPAGSGKTTLCADVAAALGLERFAPMSMAPVPQGSEVVGFRDATGNVARTPIRDVVEFGGLGLFDEFDAAYPATLVQLNNMIAARPGSIVMFPDGPVVKHEQCYFAAAANTAGYGADPIYLSRSKLDGATLNRFVFLEVGYDHALEDDMARAILPDRWESVVADARKYRAAIAEHEFPLVLSPRNVTAACDMIDAGWSTADAYRACFFGGWTVDQIRKVGATV